LFAGAAPGFVDDQHAWLFGFFHWGVEGFHGWLPVDVGVPAVVGGFGEDWGGLVEEED